jgi:hypothetical protein
MADRADSGEPLDFDAALAELAAELARMSPVERQATLDKARVRPGGLPYMPPLPPTVTAELRNGLATPSLAQSPTAYFRARGAQMAGMTPEDQLNELGRGAALASELTGVPGLVRAGNAVGDAAIDPSISSVAKAGAATGAALMRPAVVLGSLGAGYAGAAAKDLGLLDPSQAQAQTRLRPSQERAMEMDRRRREQESAIRTQEADAETERNLKAEAARKDREQYDTQIASAEARLQDALANAKRGKFEDTETKKFYDATAGYTPAILPAVTGAVSRLVGGNNPIAKYALPVGVGIPEGVIGANAPLGYDAYIGPPAYNPTREAYEEYARDLPPTDPAGRPTRRAEWQAYARGLPEENPIRAAASKEFYDPTKLTERSLYGGAEGGVGGYLGSAAASLLAKGANALAAPFRGSGRQGPQLGSPAGPSSGGPLTGVGTQGTPSTPLATLASEEMAPGVARNALGGGQAQRQLPSPEAASSQPSSSSRPTYNGHPLPPGVELDVNGLPYDVRTGHKIRTRLFRGRDD